MRKKALALVMLFVVLVPALARANHPDPLPSTISTPNFSYNVNFTNANPPPATDANFFPSTQAQNIANALNNSNPATAGNPNGYHTGYTNLGFGAPDFGGTPRNVNVFDCTPHGGCDSGNAPDDKIQMPAPTYSGASEACLRTVIGHELFHHVQYGYITFDKWAQWGGVPVEGTARLMQDKIFSDLDGNAGCITYNGEVGNYLGNTNRTVWNISYTSALFWNYLMEQLGATTAEPQRGVDFIRKFWENAQANNDSPDLVGTLRQTIAQFNSSVTLEGIWHDFTIVNYAKDLNVAGLDDALKYRYYDENDATGQRYVSVTKAWSGTIPPARGPVADSVVRWGAQYYEATIDPNCRGIVGFRSTGDNAAYSLIAVKGTNTADRVYKNVTGTFARALIQRPGPTTGYTKLAAVVAGLDSNANYTYTFDCGPAKLQIVDPTPTHKAYVGEPASPDRFLIRLSVTGPTTLGEPSVQGLDPSDFQIYVGAEDPANRATVVSGAYVQGQYWLVAQAPVKPATGTFPLLVKLGDLASDVKESAVLYEKQILDQVLVIDRSGSMLSPATSPKLDAAKNAAKLFVDSARSQDKLGVVSFGGDNVEPNDDATLNRQLQDVTDPNRSASRTAIDGISTNPSVLTSIGDGMTKGANEFVVRGSALGEDWIVLMSDGMENEAAFWRDVKPAIQAAGIKVNAIALGPLTDQPLLQSIASDTGGTYYYVDVGSGTSAPSGLAAPAAAASALANRLGDAYAAVAEKMQHHERLWDANGALAPGGSTAYNIVVKEGGISDGLFSFNWTRASDTLQVRIIRPNGTQVLPGDPGVQIFSDATHRTIRVGALTPGTWQVQLQALAGSPEYLGILSGKDQQGAQLDLYFGQYNPDPFLRSQNGLFMRGIPMPVLTTLTDRKGPVRGAKVVASVDHPDGKTDTLQLFDDGNHGDGTANDGIYGNLYTRTTIASPTAQPDNGSTSANGSYSVRVDASGKDNFGAAFGRIKQGAFQIFEGRSRDQKDSDTDKDGMPDRYEQLHPCLNPAVADADKDPDNDSLRNIDEFKLGTDPCDADSDHGGESDRSELSHGGNPLDPRDDTLPRPIDVEVIDWVLDHVPSTNIQPNSNLIRYPVNPAYAKIRVLRSTSPSGPFAPVAEFGAHDQGGLFRDGGLTNDTTYYYQIVAVDLQGHTSAPSHVFSGTPRTDGVPPIGHVFIARRGAFVDTPLVTLRLAVDPDAATPQAGATEMLISNRPTFAGAQWVPLAEQTQWQLAPDPRTGLGEVFVKYRDAAGNESTIYHDEVTVKPQGTLGGIKGKAHVAGQPNLAGIMVSVAGQSDIPPAFTDAGGNFILIGLLQGPYDLVFQRDGQGSARLHNVQVTAGQTTDVGDVELTTHKVYLPVTLR